MYALNVLNISPQCSICTMFEMFTDELFLDLQYVLLLQGSGMGRKSWDILHY
jgi:hypothetical protein